MPIDWNVYNDEIDAVIEKNKKVLIESIFDNVKDFIGIQIYLSLEDLIPLIDFDKDDFTLRMSWECCIDKTDDRNILFSLKEELDEYDGGDFERLDKLKAIFQNSIKLIHTRIKQLEEEWGRD